MLLNRTRMGVVLATSAPVSALGGYGDASIAVSTTPYGGVPITVNKMRALVKGALDREQSQPIRKLAEDILAQVKAKDYVSEVAAIHNWILTHSRYTLDPKHVEYLQSPLSSLQRTASGFAGGRRAGMVDCDDEAQQEAALNMVTGKSASFWTISTARGRPEHHIFTVIKVPTSDMGLVVDPIPGRDTTAMLRSVVTAREWPIEPRRYANGTWGVAGPIAHNHLPNLRML